MSQEALCAFGAIAIAALVASAGCLWRLLRDIPASRRLIDLLMPASQIVLVICPYALMPYFPHWDAIAILMAPMGVACAFLNPLFFRELRDAERAEIEADRVSFLEKQMAAQEQYAAHADRTQEEALHMRRELDARLARVEKALALGNGNAARKLAVCAEWAMRTPKDRCCQHPVVDALLSAKAAWCSKEGIPVDVTTTVPDDLSTPDVELCALFANAFDNAVNACRATPGGERWVRVRAYPAHGHFLLEVENSCADEDDAAIRRKGAFHSPFTVGLPRHGHGLAIMHEIVRRHEGELSCERDAGTFRLSAIWKL